MKYLIVFALVLYSSLYVTAKSTIIIRVGSPNQMTIQKIISHLTNIPGVTLEYKCSDAGIIVIKENKFNSSDPRELKAYIKNQLSKADHKFRILLIEVIIESKETSSNC